MGILESMFGGDPKQYVHSGFELTHQLISEFSLTDWINGRPATSEVDQQYLDEMMDEFIESSNAEARRKGGETLSYSPEYWNYVQRAITDCALRLEAIESTDAVHWTVRLSTYLKAWASGLNPWALLYASVLLYQQNQARFAKRALEICSLFPRYWNSRPPTESNMAVLSYVTIRLYVYRYSKENLMDIGEVGFIQKLANDVEAVRREYC